MKNAPIVELVIGVQFRGHPIAIEDIFRVYWERFREKYPVVSEVDPLPLVLTADDTQIGPQSPGSRKHFRNDSTGRLIQLQSNKLYLNWRRTPETDGYPRFTSVYEEFEQCYSILSEYCGGDLEPNHFELSYVDHFPIPDGAPVSLGLLNVPMGIGSWSLSLRKEMPQLRGDLTSIMNTALSRESRQHLIVVNTAVRGYTDDSREVWFDRAHQEQLSFFEALATDQMKKALGGNEQ